MKRIIPILLIFALIISLCACGPVYATIDSESEAIEFAKESPIVLDEIAECWGLQYAYEPDWESCTAEKNSAGRWYVVLKGSVSGYKNADRTHQSRFNDFTAYVEVQENCEIYYVRVTKY